MKKSILSCIQPSGELHIGNYLGAIKNWVQLQSKFNCVYGIADYHPMTIPHNPEILKNNTIEMVFDLLACGVKPESLFIQSMIPEHAELCWILGCATSYGKLLKQTQFKDKSAQVKQTISDKFISGGLFYYPVLQAADILIYHADYVPVGKDQEQHLELARDIALRFNAHFNTEYFILPEPLFSEIPKVMSLLEPDKKMSKSLGNKHYIGIFEDKEIIRKKVRSAVTDTGENNSIMSTGIENLIGLLKAFNENDLADTLIEDFHANRLKYVVLKDAVANAIIKSVTPFQQHRKYLVSNKTKVLKSIFESSQIIRKKAIKTIDEVKEIVGLYSSNNLII